MNERHVIHGPPAVAGWGVFAMIAVLGPAILVSALGGWRLIVAHPTAVMYVVCVAIAVVHGTRQYIERMREARA